MKPNFYKKKSTRILALFIAFTIVFFTNNVNAQCINTSAYASAVAPTSGTTTISTCNYLTEYCTISSVVAGATYTCGITGPSATPGYVTVTEVTPTGVIVSHGANPLTWTANTTGTHYIHWTVDSLCATATGCHVSTIMFGAPVLGCTNPNAINYNPLANQDDGSCVLAGCVAGIGANLESFEDPAVGLYGQGPWVDWNYDVSTSTFSGTNGWRKDNLGTGSLNTGPLNGAPSLDGDYYLYCETSGQYNLVANLISTCVDLNNFIDPAFVFGYSMYGATMGTLNIDVSTDGGTTWINEWTKSGDQGQPWQEGVINLQNSYAGQIVQVRMNYTSGTSFTGDCAIDHLRFMESPNAGCMDPFAINYDSLATMDDGSCLYPGCTDPAAVNYCASCNLNDSLSCIYPASNLLPICDDFESASLSTNQWTTLSATAVGAGVQLTVANAIVDTVSLEMTGSDVSGGWVGAPSTEAAAFANTSHVSSASILLDLSSITGPVDLSFDYKTESFYSLTGGPFAGSVYSSMRVKINGTVVSDINGNSWHGSEDLTSLIYDLSSYAGQSLVSVTFESACRYNSNYISGLYGDFVWIDNVCAFEVTPCSYYDIAASLDADVSCNGGSDGSVSVDILGMDTSLTYNNSYVWTDASGTVVGNTSNVIGLAAGTYTCTATDSANGCSASSSIIVAEPVTPVQVAAIVVPSSTPISNNGSVDITVTGGTPCYTGSPILITEYDASAPDALEIQNVSNVPVDVTGWTVTVSQSYTDINLANTIVQTLSGTMLPGETKFWTDASGPNYWGNNLFWNNGVCASFKGWIMIKDASGTVVDVFVACWSDIEIAASTVGLAGMWIGNGFDQSTLGPIQSASRVALGNSSAAFVVASTSLGVTNTGLNLPFASAGAYSFVWSTGDTTEDVSGLGMGPVSIIATDCNGCTGAWNGFIIATTTSGCIDPTAQNYDPSANADCASNPIISGLYGDTSCCLYPGCIDSTASNYNPIANVSDSSCIYPGCMSPTAINYNPQANVDDGSCQPCSGLIVLDNQTFSCYGANDGSVSVSALACVNWNWLDNGSTIGNRQNMSPGVYTLVGMTCDSACFDTLVVTITEQSAITASTSIGNEFPSGSSNGSIDLTVIGGTPCIVASSLVTHNSTLSQNGSSGVHFNITNTSSASVTITDFSQGSYTYSGANTITVYSMPAPYDHLSNTLNGTWVQVGQSAVTIPTGGTFAAPVYSSPVVLSVPVVIPAGATYGFYVGGTSTVSYATATNAGAVGSSVASDAFISVSSGHGGTFGAGSFSPRAPVVQVGYGDPSASPYTYAWSTGDTTQDISGLIAGQYCVTVTDCNGCASSFCDSVLVSPTTGCTDSTAANYNPLANQDDGSCWYVILGCIDSTAANFDPLANTDDGSCCFVSGCTDPTATNYNSVACFNDSSCIYPSANIHPFCEDVESQSFITNGWVVNNNTYASATIMTAPYSVNPAGTTINPLGGAASILFDGGSSPTGWTSFATEAQRYANTTHTASASIIMDLSAAAASCEMSFNAQLNSGFSNVGYSNIRVKVDGVVIADVNGTTCHANNSGAWPSGSSAGAVVTYNMSAYSGQTVTVTFEYAGKYNASYSSGLYGCPAIIDDICFYDLTACSYYSVSASVDSDVTCNGGSDGSATASASFGSGAYSYAWDNGAITATASGLSSGTYCCVITDDTLGCVDSLCITVIEPLAVSLSAIAVDPSAAGNDGSIDLSVSGGTPCSTSDTILSGTHASNYTATFTRGYSFQAQSSFAISGISCPDDNSPGIGGYQSVEIVDFGPNPPAAYPGPGSSHTVLFSAIGDAMGWISCNVNIIAGNYYGVVGAKHALAGGSSQTMYNSYGQASPIVLMDGLPTTLSRMVLQSSLAAGSPASGSYMDNPTGVIGRINLATGVVGASAYTYVWSTGDSTEDVSGLAAGTYSVTATDCAGCTSTASYTLLASICIEGCMDSIALNYNAAATCDSTSGAVCTYCSYGCTDSTAFNYNPSATCDDGSCIAAVYGCTDPTACNYYPGANVDDGSCEWTSCAGTCGGVTGVNLTDVIHDRATFNWDNMNSSTCQVDQIRIRYREVGTNSWTNKTMGAPVGSGCNTTNTSKLVLNLTASTQYEYDFKIWYCNAATVNWHSGGTFTTADACLNATNVTATPVNTTKTTFCWDAPASPWSFVRLKYRIDSAGTSFSNIGGFGVLSPTLCKDKNGLTPGIDYRVMWRTWCNATGGPYRSPVWDGPVTWTQPSSIRLEGGESIVNLDVYPNPSRDVFNVTFTSENVQDLEVRVINIVGEVLYTENLEQFVGEYTKSVDLATYTKGVYFLEISTNNGVVNKKLILQ